MSSDAGIEIRAECAELLAPGPVPASELEMAQARYALADQLDDVAGGAAPMVLDAIVIEVWRGCLELLIACAGRWEGTGKWLVREVQVLDQDQGSDYASRLHTALHDALTSRPSALTMVADEILEQAGEGSPTDSIWVHRRP